MLSPVNRTQDTVKCHRSEPQRAVTRGFSEGQVLPGSTELRARNTVSSGWGKIPGGGGWEGSPRDSDGGLELGLMTKGGLNRRKCGRTFRGVGCRSKGRGGGGAGSELECDAGLLGLLCPCNSASPPARVLVVCLCVCAVCGGGVGGVGERTEGRRESHRKCSARKEGCLSLVPSPLLSLSFPNSLCTSSGRPPVLVGLSSSGWSSMAFVGASVLGPLSPLSLSGWDHARWRQQRREREERSFSHEGGDCTSPTLVWHFLCWE